MYELGSFIFSHSLGISVFPNYFGLLFLMLTHPCWDLERVGFCCTNKGSTELSSHAHFWDMMKKIIFCVCALVYSESALLLHYLQEMLLCSRLFQYGENVTVQVNISCIFSS